MKEIGYPRPTCEECGLIELDEKGFFVVSFINRFWTAIVSTPSFGEGYSIDGRVVLDLAKGEVDNLKILLELVIAYVGEYIGEIRNKDFG